MIKNRFKELIYMCIACHVILIGYFDVDICYAVDVEVTTGNETEYISPIETEVASEIEKENRTEDELEITQQVEGSIESETITERVKVEELDLGDYQDVMEVGSRQLLVVTVLPMDANNYTLEYISSNTEVATINGMGRITAHSVGETIITVVCNDIKEEFELKVKKNLSDTELKIPVLDIELSNYESTVAVGKTLNLSATVLPVNAYDTTVDFESDNLEVATVTSSGEVKGISKGTVNIIMHAGGVEKLITLEVKVQTGIIELNETYVVLKPGETFQIEGIVKPNDADQMLKYKSTNPNVANVSDDGVVIAKDIGDTTIIVSNSDMNNTVTIIVNQDEIKEEEKNVLKEDKEQFQVTKEDKLIQKIKLQEDIVVKVEEFPILNKSILKELYINEKTLRVCGNGYTIILCGKDIQNFDNSLITELVFTKSHNGQEMFVNEGREIPGEFVVEFDSVYYKDVYLYNNMKEKYEKINNECSKEVRIKSAGTYLLSNTSVKQLETNITVVIGLIILTVMSAISYILVKKKYWFW